LRRSVYLSVLCSAVLLSHYCFAQTETFDITTFQPPKDWKKTNGQGYVLFQDAKAGNDAGFCILVVYASRKSSGDADKDFQQEWKDLVVKPNGTVPEPKIEKEKTPEGWTAVTGVTTLKESNVEYALMLVTASGFGKTTSILAKVAGDKYMPIIENFLSTMQLNAGTSNQVNNNFSGTETVDNITLNVPSNWKVNKQSSYTQLTFQNDQQKNFCQVTFYNAQPSSGNKQKDFENEWKELVEKNFTVLTLASPASIKDKQGNSFQRLGAKGTDKSGKKYYVQLNVYDCGSAIQSVLAISNTQKDLEQYDQTWQSLITAVKKQTTPIVQNSNSSTNQSNNILVNNWGKVYNPMVAYSNDNTVNMAFAGTKRGQYIFKADGTYTFHGENWGGQVKYNDNGNKMKLKNDKEYGLIDEIGNYAVNGNRLTVTPIKNTYRIVEPDGKLLRTETLALEKREYTWQTYYAVGMEENRLVLTATKENFLDGDYSTYEPAVSYPKSFCYVLNKNMFFKFQPMSLAK